MYKRYTLRFFTREPAGYEDELASYHSENEIPIPYVGDLIMLDDLESRFFKVTAVERSYPPQECESYFFETDVILEETD